MGMDIRRSINTKIWDDEWFEELSSEQKLVFLYLLTNQNTNILGIYQLSIKRIAYDTDLSKETIRKALEDFEKAGKVFSIGDNYIVLVNWLKNQSLNPNMKKSVFLLIEKLPNELKDSLLLTDENLKDTESLSKHLQMLSSNNKDERIKKKYNITSNQRLESKKASFLGTEASFSEDENSISSENSETIIEPKETEEIPVEESPKEETEIPSEIPSEESAANSNTNKTGESSGNRRKSGKNDEFNRVVNLYHQHCPSYPKVFKLSDARKQKIQIRLEEMKFDEGVLISVFQKMENSKFCRGDNKNGWKASFDWLFGNSTNWVKMIEGNYDERVISSGAGGQRVGQVLQPTNAEEAESLSKKSGF